MTRLSIALSLLLLAAGCTSSDSPSNPDGAVVCEPSFDAFESTIRPKIEQYCGNCHGSTPNFGAPVSLVDGPSLMAQRPDGTRLVDRIAERIIDGTMPPTGMPRLADEDAQALVAWASCGTQTAPTGVGLRSSGRPFLSPERSPTGLDVLDVTADEYAVGPSVRDDYRCFVFDADVDSDRFVRRFEMIYDETRVLHHVVLMRDNDRVTQPGNFSCIDGSGMPEGSQYLYAWAPGTSALEFPEGGLRVRPGERFVLQIHYNNGANIPDVTDSSGVRLYLDAPTGPEYGMIAIGPTNFSIPARETRTVSSECTFTSDATALAGMPHMHLLGDTFDQEIVRAGGSREPLISIDGWDFETQLFYDMPIQLRAGDKLTTACSFINSRDANANSGAGTEDEMCFNFLYVTPPPTERYCDEGAGDALPTDVVYTPGACSLDDAPTGDLSLVRGEWTQAAEPPALSQASVPDARWRLVGTDFYVSSANTPIGAIDVDGSYVLARGQLVTRDGSMYYDVSNDIVLLATSGVRFGEPDTISFAGPFAGTTSPASLSLTCPSGATDPVVFDWGLEANRLTIGFTAYDIPESTVWARYHFERQAL